jgi:hypothetical protein
MLALAVGSRRVGLLFRASVSAMLEGATLTDTRRGRYVIGSRDQRLIDSPSD